MGPPGQRPEAGTGAARPARSLTSHG